LTTTIDQHSQNLSLNWQSFNIGASSTVNFVQPNAKSIAVNRIADPNGSVILGRLNANGQVFLINPNGVLFGQGAQVNVGSLVASTLNISDSELASGTRHFSGNGRGSVVNQGTINAANGGYVALLGPQVTNRGTLNAPGGTVALAGGNAVTLSFDSNRLLSLQVDKSALDALADNRQLIVANGGQVLMSAGAKDSLLASVVNNSGTIQARTVENRAGKIVLLGGMAAGTTKVAGTLDASAPGGGNGGFIETSAAHVQVADGTRITTLAKAGDAGTWLIDPTDFTIAAGSGAQTSSSIGANTLSSSLGSGNVTIATAASGSENGDIHVNSAVSWSANELTLSAHGDININADLNGSGTAKLALEYGQATVAGTGSGYTLRGARVNLAAGNNFSTKQGSGGATQVYTVVTRLGVAADTTTTSLQGIGNNLAGHYVLGGDIDASATSGWNGSTGFDPIGTSYSTQFTGTFDGLGHTISGLSTERPSGYNIGLFGYTGIGSAIRNLGLLGGSVSGYENVGGLVGYNDHGTITQAYVTGAVSGNRSVGGLVGYNVYGTVSQAYATGAVGSVGCIWCGGLVGQLQAGSTISQSYATGAVNGDVHVGGLVGAMSSATISESYASGAVSGNENVGGLAGYSDTGTIIRSYATGAVTGSTAVGGLLGFMYPTTITEAYATGAVSGVSGVGGLVGSGYGGTISNSYWDTYSTGQATSVGSSATITSDPTQSGTANYAFKQSAYAGFDFTPGTGAWFMVDGSTRPFLQSEYSTTINNAHQLQLMAMNLGASYTLGSNIDAGETARAVNSVAAADASGMWSNAGFAPIGKTGWFTGIFDGLGHTISGLTINRPGTSNVGLFGLMKGTISNIGLLGGSMAGDSFVGGLAGLNSGGTITRAYTTGTVSGTGEQVGGLVGNNGGTISQSYATGAVSAPTRVGGLVGLNNGSISQSYATGAVIGAGYAGGGLVGTNAGTIDQSYATGAVGGTSNVGGLAGTSYGTITNSYWATDTSGQATSAGGNGLTTAQMMDSANFAAWGTDISAVGGSDAVWRIYEGQTGPLLRNFMTALTVTGGNVSATYDGSTGHDLLPGDYAFDIDPQLGVSGTGHYEAGSKNAGSYSNAGLTFSGLYSGQQGYDITFVAGTLTVGKAQLGLSISDVSKTYDGTTAASGTLMVSNGTLFGGDTLSGGSFAFTDKNAGTGKHVSVAGVTVSDGNGGGNYDITYVDNSTSSITAKAITIGGAAADKIYDGTTAVTLDLGGASFAGMIAGDDLSVGSANGHFNDKHAGTGKTVSIDGITLVGADAGNYRFNTTATTTADITAKAITINATGVDKIYDGSTDATISALGSTGLVSGDVVTFGNVSAAFDNKNAGTGKGITINGITATGTDAGNYSFGTTAGTTADITPATLTYRADPAFFRVGQMPGDLSGAVTGLVDGDTLADATDGTLTWGTSATSASLAGQYAINGSGLSALNYVFAQAPGNASALQLMEGEPAQSGAPLAVARAVAGLQQQEEDAATGHVPPASYAPNIHILGGGVRLP
ncbi:MAG TPA: YDG domain-containing protein, partial [Rhodanobacter sp.]|nr:YDG domain-containing protein [Rhodanobacter sp.]